MIDFGAVGLGLQYGTVRLVPADDGWANIACQLAADISGILGDLAPAVEHIGSTAVPGLLAKPIVDLAIALRPDTAVEQIAEGSPWHRVAHAHGVEFGGSQWQRYLRFRDLLRGSAAVRTTYEEAKQRLAQQYPDGRRQYTSGKDATVQRLLDSNA